MKIISKAFSYISEKQMSLQSIILWILALSNFSNGYFWFFAIPAIIISGMGDIINELRILNKTQNESEN